MPISSAIIEEAARLLAQRGRLEGLLTTHGDAVVLATTCPPASYPLVAVAFMDDDEARVVVNTLIDRIDARLVELGVEV